MLLPHHPSRAAELRVPTATAPWRVLVSGCLAGWQCGVDGSDYGLGLTVADFLALPTVSVFPFCPEQHALGTPRTTPDIHGGDGVDVAEGRAEVFDERGEKLTAKMMEGARAMVALAEEVDAELALLTDMSAACGSQVISAGCRLAMPRRVQKGVGVATALLLAVGIPVVSQRDFLTLGLLRSRAEPGYTPRADLRDHHDHPWTREHLPGPHPRAVYLEKRR